MNTMMKYTAFLSIAMFSAAAIGADDAAYETKWSGASIQELSAGLNSVADTSIQKSKASAELAKKYNDAWRNPEYTSAGIESDRAELAELERKAAFVREKIRAKVNELPAVIELKAESAAAEEESVSLRSERKIIEQYLNEKRNAGLVGSLK